MLKHIVGAVSLMGLLMPPGAHAAQYYLSWTGTVDSTNACTFPSTTDCYAPLGATISGAFHYNTGAAGLATSTQSFYRNLMFDYSLSIPASSYSGTVSNVAGFGRFSLSRDALSQATATSSTFTAYVARDAGNYTFLGGTNTADLAPRIATTAAVAGDNFYGDLAISEVRVNFGALSQIFADLLVPTTFTFADLSPSVTNFQIALQSDLFLGSNAAYSFGGGLTSVTVTPVVTAGDGPVATPEPRGAAVLAIGLLTVAGIRRRGISANLKPGTEPIDDQTIVA